MKKTFLTFITISSMIFFAACSGQSNEGEDIHEENQEIIEQTEEDLLNQIEEEEETEASVEEEEEEVEQQVPVEGVIEVDVKTVN